LRQKIAQIVDMTGKLPLEAAQRAVQCTFERFDRSAWMAGIEAAA
jgi:hypothetical protein